HRRAVEPPMHIGELHEVEVLARRGGGAHAAGKRRHEDCAAAGCRKSQEISAIDLGLHASLQWLRKKDRREPVTPCKTGETKNLLPTPQGIVGTTNLSRYSFSLPRACTLYAA